MRGNINSRVRHLPDPQRPIRRDDLGAAYWQGGRRLACAVWGQISTFYAIFRRE